MDPNYQKYLEEKFIGLSAQIKSQNDMQDIRMKQMQESITELKDTVDKILSHVQITNGRVTKLENENDNCPINEVQKQVKTNTETINEIKFVKKYFKPLITGVITTIIIAIISTLKSFGIL